MRIAVVAVASIALAGAWTCVARAGGTQVGVVATAGRVWVATGANVVELDAASGRVLHRVAARYPFPLEIGASDGAIWVSSVENGFVAGAVTRIPFDSARTSQPLVCPTRPIFSLAVGSSTTWALVGPWPRLALAAIDQATRSARLVRLPVRLGWIAADDTGGTPGLFGVTAGGVLERVGASGTALWRASTGRIMDPPAVGLGRVWAASTTSLYAVDAASGRVDGRLPLRNTSVQLAVGGGRLWVLSSRQARGAQHYELVEVATGPLRVVRRVALRARADAIAYGDGSVWLGRDVPTVAVVRVSPRTLAQRTFARGLG